MEKENMKDPRRVTVVLTFEQLESLRSQLIVQGVQEGRKIGLSDGIRRAVEQCYPIPKQIELPL